MSGETYVISNIGSLKRFIAWLWTLDFSKPWMFTVKRVEPGASVELEAVLRGKERLISEFTGHDMEEIHDAMLIRHYGKETIILKDGTEWERPARRTRTGKNKLSYSETVEHVRFVEAFGATLGIRMK
jgi:hypothetical protein